MQFREIIRNMPRFNSKVYTRKKSVKMWNRPRKEVDGVERQIHPCKIFALFLILNMAIPLSLWALQWWEEDGRVRPISEQLSTRYEAIQEFLADAEKDLAIGGADSIIKILKDGLHSAKDRISSIRTQTQGYERMAAKIPGGPTHFISSSIQELSEIRTKVFALDDLMKMVFTQLRKEGTLEYMMRSKYSNILALFGTNLEDLFREGIFFMPHEKEGQLNDEPKMKRNQDFIARPGPANETIDALKAVGEIFSTLSHVFSEREQVEREILDLTHLPSYGYLFLKPFTLKEVVDQATDHSKFANSSTFANSTSLLPFLERHSMIDGNISRFVEKYGPSQLEWTLPLVMQLITRISVLKENVGRRTEDHFTGNSMAFKKEIENDLDRLIQRLVALKG